MPLRKSHKKLLTALVVAGTVAAPAGASAATSLSQNLTCAGQAVSSPFAAWGDNALYWLAPGGDFESYAAGWTLKNASVVTGNETLGIAPGTKSLQLGGSKMLTTSSTTSPAFCVDPTHPQFRFTVKNNTTSALLSTFINFKSATGATLTVPAKLNTYTFGKWSLSASQPLATQIPAAFLGTGTTATITFSVATALLAGTVNIDNVMIDPYRRG